ncbi:hypothetical protein TWF730_009076 [Orbilia blumenaviensis]|uniref:F-box domain-containing protein n=1 Tax=Orbilia blumenaviensis TaxID=1796055 RepID=A0AAV9UY64_9PEZI
MASLASLPQELVDMIFSDLLLHEIGKVRGISKDHNERFKHLFWHKAFDTIHTTLKVQTLERLLGIAKGADDELQRYLQHIIIHPIESYNEVKHPKVKSLLTRIMGALPCLKTVEFDIRMRWSHVFDHWRPVMDAILASRRQTVEVIKGPRAGLAMSSLNLREKQLIAYENTFTNLKSLEITTSVQTERADVTFAFWSWVMVIGDKLEDLAVAGYRSTSIHQPKPDAEGRFLPSRFNLPNLKNLELVDVCLTLKDMKVMLRNTDKIESINISGCIAEDNRPSYFFKLLKYLQTRGANKLQYLELPMWGYHDGIVIYELPNLTLTGNWTDEKTMCKVELNIEKLRYSGVHTYTCEKSLWKELGKYETTKEFWDSMTDNKWMSKEITNWKKLMWAEPHRRRPSCRGGTANHEWARLFQLHAVYHPYNDPRWIRPQDQTRLNVETVDTEFERNPIVLEEINDDEDDPAPVDESD